MSLKEFKILRFIGKGSYGSVHTVKRLSDGNVYAMKEVKLRNMSLKEREEAVNEIRLLASVRHENILRYHEAFIQNDRLYIITEYCSGGDLSTRVSKQKSRNRFYDEETVWRMFIQMLKGLRMIHGLNILHRDMKSPNIFLADNVMKIGDFGVARLANARGLARTQVGTPYYVSPEIWRNRPYDAKSDVWSLGCLLYEMCALRRPFEAANIKELAHKVLANRFSAIPSFYSKEMSDLIRKMLVTDPNRRPSVNDIMRYPAIQRRLMSSDDSEIRDRCQLRATIRVPRERHKMAKLSFPSPCYPTPPNKAGKTTKVSAARLPTMQPKSERVDKENARPPVNANLPPRPDKKLFPWLGRPAEEPRRHSFGQRRPQVPRQPQYMRRVPYGYGRY